MKFNEEALQAAAKACEQSATVWTGFAARDAEGVVRAYLEADKSIRIVRINHDLHDREDGLDHCKACNGFEGSLPTECPGTKMSYGAGSLVHDKCIDFKDGQWVNLQFTPKELRDAL